MAVNRSGSLHVKGLTELRRELARLDKENSSEWRKELGRANHEVSTLVVNRARPVMAGLGRMGARAAATMSASRSGVSARLMLGGPKAPFAEGVEFGAVSGIRRVTRRRVVTGWNQFQSWRGNGNSAGYALFPTMRSSQTEIIAVYEAAVDRVMQRAFPN